MLAIQAIPEPPVTDDINVWLIVVMVSGLGAFFWWGIRPLFKTMQEVLQRLSDGDIVTSDRAEERRELVSALHANTEAWTAATKLMDTMLDRLDRAQR